MTVTRGLALVLTVAVVGVVGGRPGTAADTPAAPSAKLKTISERQGRSGPSLVIETSEPVPYLTTRPDPSVPHQPSSTTSPPSMGRTVFQ